MNKKMYHHDLKKLKEKKGGGCVSFARVKGDVYFTVNGIAKKQEKKKTISNGIAKKQEKKKTISDTLSNMFKPKEGDSKEPTFCDYSYAYTVIDPSKDIYVKNEKLIQNTFNKDKKIFLGDIIYPMKYNPIYENRNWTCCERKIIGYLLDNHIIQNGNKYVNDYILDVNDYILDLYVTRMPCPLCIPLVAQVNYLDENNQMIVDKYTTKQVVHNVFEVKRKNIKIIK